MSKRTTPIAGSAQITKKTKIGLNHISTTTIKVEPAVVEPAVPSEADDQIRYRLDVLRDIGPSLQSSLAQQTIMNIADICLPSSRPARRALRVIVGEFEAKGVPHEVSAEFKQRLKVATLHCFAQWITNDCEVDDLTEIVDIIKAIIERAALKQGRAIKEELREYLRQETIEIFSSDSETTDSDTDDVECSVTADERRKSEVEYGPEFQASTTPAKACELVTIGTRATTPILNCLCGGNKIQLKRLELPSALKLHVRSAMLARFGVLGLVQEAKGAISLVEELVLSDDPESDIERQLRNIAVSFPVVLPELTIAQWRQISQQQGCLGVSLQSDSIEPEIDQR